MVVERGPIGSHLFGYARALVRAAAEREKPSAERLPGYADSQLPLLEKQVLDASPVYPALEQQTLEFWLSKAREYLTADDPDTRLLLGKDSPENLSKTLATSKLGDAAVRKALWDGGMAAVKASRDPMIQYVLRIDPEARRLLTPTNDKVIRPDHGRVGSARQGPVRRLRDQRLSRRDVHPAPLLRQDRRLDREGS